MQIGQHIVGDYLITLSSCTNPVRNNIIYRLNNMIIGKYPVPSMERMQVINKLISSGNSIHIDKAISIGDKLLFTYWINSPYWYLFKTWTKLIK